MEDDHFDPESLQDILPLYYRRLFPYGPFFRWLRYDNIVNITNREFSFTLAGDVYLRYQSVTSMENLKQQLQKDLPIKIDVGAIYSKSPQNHHKADFTAMSKELVFDIDMTDYDDIRTCCSGADVCLKCWKFMSLACKILDTAIREDFGFEHLLWVFSGRRGVHCWVCDEKARNLNITGRQAVVEYLNILRGNTTFVKRVELTRTQIHSSILRALDITREYFEDICLVDQDILSDERMNKFVDLIGNGYKSFKAELHKVLEEETTSKARWNAFVNHVTYSKNKGTLPKGLLNLVDEMMLHYTYPRLDVNVSKGLNHLLKSPFCIHPKTGKICVPFSVKSVDKFNPLSTPTISLLVKEINAFDAKTNEQDEDLDSSVRKVKDYRKTSMYKGVVVFEEFVRKMETTWKKNENNLDF